MYQIQNIIEMRTMRMKSNSNNSNSQQKRNIIFVTLCLSSFFFFFWHFELSVRTISANATKNANVKQQYISMGTVQIYFWYRFIVVVFWIILTIYPFVVDIFVLPTNAQLLLFTIVKIE